VVTFGAYMSNILVPWLGLGLPTNLGGTSIPTHPTTTLRTWLARTHPPDCPTCIQHQTFFGESTYLSQAPFAVCPFGVSGVFNTPPVWLSLGGSDGRGIPFLVRLGSILLWVSETRSQKAWTQVTQSPWPFSPACH
jgi:hypothetical protein